MSSAHLEVAKECFRRPGKASLWSERHNRYVCPGEAKAIETPESSAPLRLHNSSVTSTQSLPDLGRHFKLIFLTSVCGTALFILLCVGLTILAEGEPPALTKELVDGFFGLAQIGFGAIVGLLGGKAT
jgi:hypothetical protein